MTSLKRLYTDLAFADIRKWRELAPAGKPGRSPRHPRIFNRVLEKDKETVFEIRFDGEVKKWQRHIVQTSEGPRDPQHATAPSRAESQTHTPTGTVESAARFTIPWPLSPTRRTAIAELVSTMVRGRR